MTKNIYEILSSLPDARSAVIENFQVGLTWTSCRVNIDGQTSLGFAMTPHQQTRTLDWPGTIAGQTVEAILPKLESWQPFDSVLVMSACNATVNSQKNGLLSEATLIDRDENANLSVFTHFKPFLFGKKVVIVGRYPWLDTALEDIDYQVLERMPQKGDLPDTAAETVLPKADWVFITASSLVNKTFPRLASLAENAVTVLMGPTTPWMKKFADYSIDFLAGTVVTNQNKAEQIVMEGGGTRLFDEGVQYAVLNIGQERLSTLKQKIAATAEQRRALKVSMEDWYLKGNKQRFPEWQTLELVDKTLSGLDSSYKRLWDANQQI